VSRRFVSAAQLRATRGVFSRQRASGSTSWIRVRIRREPGKQCGPNGSPVSEVRKTCKRISYYVLARMYSYSRYSSSALFVEPFVILILAYSLEHLEHLRAISQADWPARTRFRRVNAKSKGDRGGETKGSTKGCFQFSSESSAAANGADGRLELAVHRFSNRGRSPLHRNADRGLVDNLAVEFGQTGWRHFRFCRRQLFRY